MKVTKYYCDKCSNEFEQHKLRTIKVLIQSDGGNFFETKRDVCKECRKEMESKIMDIMNNKR